MSNSDYRIPDEMAAEVLAEAARLYAQTNKGYSFEDLQQACSEAQIPSHIIRQALKNVEEKRSRDRTKRLQEQEYIKQQVKRGLSIGIILLIPAIAVSSIFIFRSVLKPVVSELVSRSFKTLTVKIGKLEYLTDSKGLSIAIHSTSRYSSSVEGTIGTDGYKNFAIQSGKVGDFYEYKGIYNYLIKIIEVGDDSVTFQIDQQGQQPQSSVKRFEEEVKQLQQQHEELQSQSQRQIYKLQNKQDDIKQELQQRDETIKQLERELQQRDKTIERLEQENNRLKSQRSSN